MQINSTTKNEVGNLCNSASIKVNLAINQQCKAQKHSKYGGYSRPRENDKKNPNFRDHVRVCIRYELLHGTIWSKPEESIVQPVQ